ncbi:MAG: 50S ribosomal protein L18 [Nanoarchaeota archaeon]|nr:50S ribosomal protein L18 [Nanoarchaeota archaeon]MBU4116754.1 50S ribosomal protein L18 [Nanoarchaeota archaeon]
MKTFKRRRRENKTDYGNRLKLLKSETPRIVFRKTNKYVILQYVVSEEARDKVIIGVTSKNLLKYGWPKEFEGSLKSIPAAYLTGLLIGKKILKEKLKTPIVDFGMIRPIHKTKIYGFLKGLIDSGIEIKHKAEIFPEEEKIKGKNLKKDFTETFTKIKSKIEQEK